jgi:NAD(P)-dependent dehydrogenase (short-subunit alcohol dehydrogenase family)
MATLDETDPELWDQTFDINARGPYLMCRAMSPRLKRGVSPAVVNVSSTLAERAIPGMAAYNASKAALNQLTRSLALEWAPAVRVNAVSPAERGVARGGGHTDPRHPGDVAGGCCRDGRHAPDAAGRPSRGYREHDRVSVVRSSIVDDRDDHPRGRWNDGWLTEFGIRGTGFYDSWGIAARESGYALRIVETSAPNSDLKVCSR